MKNSGQNQLDELLKDKLSEGTAQVPDFVWERIEEELFPEKKRRGFFWWFFGGFCTLLIGTFIAIGLEGATIHSEQAAISKQKTLKDPKVFVSEDRTLKRKSNSPDAINEHKISGHQLSDFRSFDSKSRQNYSRSRSENHIRFGKSSGILSNIPLKEKRYSITPSGENNELSAPSLAILQVALQPKEENQSLTSESEKQKVKNTQTDTKEEVPAAHELSYAEILELIKRDFPEMIEPEEKTPPSLFSLGVFGGPSLYNSAVFKDYFTSGQLSKRTFASSGFELGLQAQFKLGNRFKVYAALAFNQKQTQFSYNLAITEADYFTYIVNNEKVPLENIRDDGMNSCFLAKDVIASYQLKSVLISLGTSFEFLRFGKFSAAADVRLSGNPYSVLKLKEIQVLDIAQPSSESFSYLQPVVGLSLNYRLNQRISVGLAPFLSKQFYLKKSFSRKLDELVIPVTLSFHF